MNLLDRTKNQHFVSQVEQRLNAIDPSLKNESQKIHSFTLKDRESLSIKLDSAKGKKISTILSLHDLFSFDVLGKEADRYNFEALFYRYESEIKVNTDSLLSKLPTKGADIKDEIIGLFLAKFLNFVRNPYSIKKVLNTFPQLTNVHPTDQIHYANFRKVIEGRKPQQKYLCEKLGISEEYYIDWLSVLFLLLTPLENGKSNLFEQLVRDLYLSPELFTMVIIHTYDNHSCLLSDRGYSIPLPDKEHMVWDFNLYSKGFIRYAFGDLNKLAPANAPEALVKKYKAMPKSTDVHNVVNDLDMLAKYNQNVVYQCHSKVFSSSKECFGL
ncbi:hypothetical protein FR932_08815 [Moritella marina ATCC 15381]|uniref:DUF4238 domain-containing protein n=1 Tax=Moritella marina ATCC 15381 TaxID=1202962 RepID=A0A5J6WIT8_MORMI|nr:hypothetical protein [Moritella marina]QFI37943.1 hypothetical protein FR932_08815 [Moritella marina ATCC 15381]